MDDPFVVGELQCIADLGYNGQRFGGRHFAGLYHPPQIRPIDEFHDEVIQAGVRMAEIVNRDDVRIVQPG